MLDAHPAPGTNLRGIILNDISMQYYQHGQPNTAIEYLDDTLVLLETTGRGRTVGYQRVAANRAAALQNLGRTPEALEAFADVVERMRASGFQGRGVAPLFAQYGDLLMSVRRVDEAESLFAEGLVLAESTGDIRVAAFLNVGLAKVALAGKAYDQAMQRLDQAYTAIEADARTDRVLARRIQLTRVKVHRGAGNLDAAAREIDALLIDTGYPQKRETPGMVSALIEGAEVYRQRRDYIKARELVDGLVERLQEHTRPNSQGGVHLGRALVQRAEILLESGDPAGAVADIELALPNLVYALGEDHREVEQAKALLADAREAE